MKYIEEPRLVDNAESIKTAKMLFDEVESRDIIEFMVIFKRPGGKWGHAGCIVLDDELMAMIDDLKRQLAEEIKPYLKRDEN